CATARAMTSPVWCDRVAGATTKKGSRSNGRSYPDDHAAAHRRADRGRTDPGDATAAELHRGDLPHHHRRHRAVAASDTIGGLHRDPNTMAGCRTLIGTIPVFRARPGGRPLPGKD